MEGTLFKGTMNISISPIRIDADFKSAWVPAQSDEQFAEPIELHRRKTNAQTTAAM